jgi:hypothetical protein
MPSISKKTPKMVEGLHLNQSRMKYIPRMDDGKWWQDCGWVETRSWRGCEDYDWIAGRDRDKQERINDGHREQKEVQKSKESVPGKRSQELEAEWTVGGFCAGMEAGLRLD